MANGDGGSPLENVPRPDEFLATFLERSPLSSPPDVFAGSEEDACREAYENFSDAISMSEEEFVEKCEDSEWAENWARNRFGP